MLFVDLLPSFELVAGNSTEDLGRRKWLEGGFGAQYSGSAVTAGD